MIPNGVLELMAENEDLAEHNQRLRVSLSAALDAMVKAEREMKILAFNEQTARVQLAQQKRRATRWAGIARRLREAV